MDQNPNSTVAPPSVLVIFGASGDLTQRKLIPSLYNVFKKGRLPANLHILGYARRPYDDVLFREHMREGMIEFAPDQYNAASWDDFAARLHYFQGNLDQSADYDTLKQHLVDHFGGACNHYYYLATAPTYFETIIANLGNCGLSHEGANGSKIIIEKPFGSDLKSAQSLNQFIHTVFNEDQIFRIDHYLGKETAQNILFFRFSNAIFEPVWNRNYIDHVQITVAESVDVGHRAGYYDNSGILRDMFQNHLLQLLTLTAMESPATFNATALRNEKVKVLQAVRPIAMTDVVLGQYEGYRQAEQVAADSRTPTFAAMRLYVNNWRWQGVPFYLRSGKAMPQKTSEISIFFRCPPHNMFNLAETCELPANVLSIIIQPNEGIHLSFVTKQPDSYQNIQSVNMNFYYRDMFGENPLPDAYERLLLDALNHDASLFARADEIEQSWKIIDPVIQYSENPHNPPPSIYAKDTWGPKQTTDLIADNGGCWHIMQGSSGVCTL